MKRDDFLDKIDNLTTEEYETLNAEYSQKIISLFNEIEQHIKNASPDLDKSVHKEMEKPARRARSELRLMRDKLNQLIKFSVLKSRMHPESRLRKFGGDLDE